MKAEHYRSTLEPIGCWPPTCHSCSQKIRPDEEMTFVPTSRTWNGSVYFAGTHASCTTPPSEPDEKTLRAQREAKATGKPSGGPFLTAEEIEAVERARRKM